MSNAKWTQHALFSTCAPTIIKEEDAMNLRGNRRTQENLEWGEGGGMMLAWHMKFSKNLNKTNIVKDERKDTKKKIKVIPSLWW